MPVQRIDLKGIMTDLSPESVPQGACQEMVNLRFLDGAWRPVSSKKIDWKQTADVKLLYIHKVEAIETKIIKMPNSSYLLYLHKDPVSGWGYSSMSMSDNIDDELVLRSINSLLLVYNITACKLYYCKMEIDGEDCSYTELLNFDIQLPQLDFYSSYNTFVERFFTTLEEHKETAKSNYLSAKDELEEAGMFTSSIYARYALKMFDGSYIYQSNIQKIDSYFIPTNPFIGNYGKDIGSYEDLPLVFDQNDNVSYKHGMRVFGSYLRFTVTNESWNETIITTLKKHKDLIKSLDIFVSQPVEIWKIDDLPCHVKSDWGGELDYFEKVDINNTDEIDSVNNFYLFKSISIDKLTIGTDESLGFVKDTGITPDYKPYHDIHLGNNLNTGQNLTFGQTISESLEYKTKGKFTSKKILPIEDTADVHVARFNLIYNNRTMLANVVVRLFGGFSSRAFCIQSTNAAVATPNNTIYRVYVFYHIDTEDGTKVVRANQTYEFFPTDTGYKLLINAILTYPNVKCKQIDLFIYTGGSVIAGYSYEMRPHPFLNCAYAFIGDNDTRYDTCWIEIDPYLTNGLTTLPTVSTSFYNDRNRVMVSRVNNPFSFPAEDTNNVGSNDIVGILTNSKQMTEGQFGMHPIIVLTKNGIYAIEIGTGSIFTQRIVPVSSDECLGGSINFYSKTLATDVIVYLSRTGVKMLNGTESVDLTQYVKYNKPSALNPLALTENDPFLIAATTELTAVGKYGQLTADSGGFSTGDWIYKQSGSPTYVLMDKSYWFFTNFDNYLVAHINEKDDWENNLYEAEHELGGMP